MIRHLIPIIATLLIISCTSVNVEKTLLDVESYIKERPDSALSILDSIDRNLLNTRKLRSHHALLHATALDKNYIDVSDDSLALTALEWFDKHGDDKYKARSLYYLGLSHYYSKDYNRAILELTKAEKIAETSDSLYWGLIKSLQGSTYIRTYNSNEELKCIQKAYEIYSGLSEEYYMDISKYRLGRIYLNKGQYDKAERIFEELLEREKVSDYVLGNTLCSYAYMKVIKQEDNARDILCMYEDAISRFGNKYMTIKDWWGYASLLDKVGRKEEVDNLIKQLEKIDSTSTKHYWKYFIAKNKGESDVALKYLEESCEADNKVIADVLSQSLAISQRDFYEAKSDISEYKIKIRTLVLMISVISFLLTIVILSIVISSKSRKYKEDKERYIQYAEEITRQFNELKNDDIPSLKKRYLELYKSKFENLRVLCDNYLQFQGRDNAEKSMYSKVVSMINDIRTDMQDCSKFEDMLNADLNGIMTAIRNEIKMKEIDYIIFSYLIIGFDATTISRLIDTTVNTVYIRKSRIKRHIEESISPHKNEFLAILS